MLIVLLFGIGLRFSLVNLGHNFDFDSYLIVAKIVDSGENVYASTGRYNYGPVWFYILHLIYEITLKNDVAFRFLLVVFLSSVDLAIFAILSSPTDDLLS